MRNRPRGIALLSILLLSIVLLILLGAFIRINRSAFGGVTSYVDEGVLRQTALSGLEYATARLRNDENWGYPSGSNTPWDIRLDSPDLKVWEREEDGLVRVVGATKSSGFQIVFHPQDQPVKPFELASYREILENPSNPEAWQPGGEIEGRWLSTNRFKQPLSDVQGFPRSGLRPIPGRYANVQVCAFTNSEALWLDSTVRKPNVLNHGLVAKGKVGVGLTEGGLWSVLSDDPFVNEISSSEDFTTPNALSSSRPVNFGPSGGKLLSGKEIILADELLVTSTSPLQTLTSGIQGVIGDGTNDESEKRRAFETSKGEFLANQATPHLQVQEGGGDGDPAKIESIPGGSFKFIDDRTLQRVDSGGSVLETYRDTIPGTTVKLEAGQIKVPVGVSLTIAGDFFLERASDFDRANYLVLGDALSEDGGASVTISGDATMQGAVVGSGTLKTDGSLTLQGKSQLMAPRDAGISLYTGGDLNFTPVDPVVEAEIIKPGEITSEEAAMFYETFRASGNNVSDEPWTSSLGLNEWGSLTPSQKNLHIRNYNPDAGPTLELGLAANRLNDGSFTERAVEALNQRANKLGFNTEDYKTLDPRLASAVPQSIEDYASVLLYMESIKNQKPDPTLLAPFSEEYLSAKQGRLPPDVEAAIDARVRAKMDALWSIKPSDRAFREFIGVEAAEPPLIAAGVDRDGSRDGEFQGVVYVGGDMSAQMDGYNLTFNGAIIAEGDVGLSDVRRLINVYNPVQVERFAEKFLVQSHSPTRVEVVYKAFY